MNSLQERAEALRAWYNELRAGMSSADALAEIQANAASPGDVALLGTVF